MYLLPIKINKKKTIAIFYIEIDDLLSIKPILSYIIYLAN